MSDSFESVGVGTRERASGMQMQVACLGHETLPDALQGLLDAPACKFA